MGFCHCLSALTPTPTTHKQQEIQSSKDCYNEKKHYQAREPYAYVPFASASTQIRLLQLLPGKRRSQISVTIETVPVGRDKDVPRFTALSYHWGPEGNESFIHVSGTDQTIAVRQNLFEALYHLRDSKTPCRLWIDAICIDQNNEEEKSEQMNLMASVFMSATEVIAWIGTGSSSTRKAMRAIRTIDETTEGNWIEPILRDSKSPPRLSCRRRYTDFDRKEAKAMVDLLARPYFSRLWVYQEIHLGADRATLLCGAHSVRWEAIRKTILFLSSVRHFRWDGLVHATISIDRWKYIQYLCDSGEHRRGFFEALDRARLADCTDDRDRAFSVMSLCGMTGIENGYNKTVQDVYTEVAIYFLKKWGSLQFLDYTGRQKYTGMPSWVPDWSCDDYVAVTLDGHTPSIWYPPRFEKDWIRYGRDPVPWIGVPGLIVDTVTYSSPKITVPPSVREQIVSGNDSDALDSVIRCLRSNTLERIKIRADGSLIESHSEMELYRVEFLQKLKRRPRLHNIYTRGRSLITTESSAPGLGPAAAVPGDKVAIIMNCYAALILRPKENGSYTVVGPAYVDGYMQREAVLGPLPDHIERVIVIEEGEMPRLEFLNRITKEFEPEDPRLGPLPEGCEKAEDGRIIDSDTGQHLEDPRLDLFWLKQHGVIFKEIRLE